MDPIRVDPKKAGPKEIRGRKWIPESGSQENYRAKVDLRKVDPIQISGTEVDPMRISGSQSGSQKWIPKN